jgi:hypothetical protein
MTVLKYNGISVDTRTYNSIMQLKAELTASQAKVKSLQAEVARITKLYEKALAAANGK